MRTIQDPEFWRPRVADVLERHGLPNGPRALVAGHNPTYPTFVAGEVVVKIFVGLPRSRETFEAERAALALVGMDPDLLAPRLLGHGHIMEAQHPPWPYLLMSRVVGTPAHEAALDRADQLGLASAMGEQVKRLQVLEPGPEVPRLDDVEVDVPSAAARSSLLPHLVEQVPEFLGAHAAAGSVFVHADLVDMHVFVSRGRLTGIIDWGDAMRADPHLELMQVHRGLFDCDRGLLAAFLESSGWTPTADFPQRALACGLRRQAIGLVQHRSMDVFEPVAALLPLAEIATLEELAERLFAVPPRT